MERESTSAISRAPKYAQAFISHSIFIVKPREIINLKRLLTEKGADPSFQPKTILKRLKVLRGVIESQRRMGEGRVKSNDAGSQA